MLDAVDRLPDFPESGRVVPETKRREIRELDYGGYRVIYRVEPERILVLTIRHSRRLFDPGEID